MQRHDATAPLQPSPTSAPLLCRSSPAGMKHLQKAFAANSPRLIAVASADSAELMEQLQQASKASDDLAVILATAADGKVRAARGSGPPRQAQGLHCGAGCAPSLPLLPTSRCPPPPRPPPPHPPPTQRLIDYYGLQVGEGVELLVEDPKAAAKYLKSGAKPSDVPEFLRQFKAG